MTRAERVKWLFMLLVLCLFVAVVLPSPKIMHWLGWVGKDMPTLCVLGGAFGTIITFLVFLCVVTDKDEKNEDEEKEETVG
jgi:hypothetical protein